MLTGKTNKVRILLSIILLLVVFLCFKSIVVASGLSTMTDQLSRINETATASHTLFFDITNQVPAAGNVQITFPASSFAFGASYSFADMILAQGSSNNCTTATFTNKTLAATPSGTTWGATFAANVVTFTSGTDTLTANTCIKVILNTNGAGHTITNPTVTSNTVYNINIATSAGDTGELAVIVLGDPATSNNDQIQINAVVAPTLTMTIDTAVTGCTSAPGTNNNVQFGILPPGTARVSSSTIQFICIGAGTNSATGMKILVQSSRNNAVGGLVNGANAIQSATANLNLAGTNNGYGLRVSTLGTTVFGSFTIAAPYNSGTSGSVGQLNGTLGSASIIVSSTAAVNTVSTNRIAVEVGAKTDTSIAQGNYSDTITFTAFTL